VAEVVGCPRTTGGGSARFNACSRLAMVGSDQTRLAASMVPAMVRRMACALQSSAWMSAGNSNQKSVACRASSSLAALVAAVCALSKFMA